MSTPRLSVVVPFYGVEDYIGDCLHSIRQQRLAEIEVVMVDDGSPDGSRAVAEELAAADPRFRLVTQENAGLGPARNTGVEHARAEYLTFVDSDDLVTRHAFERMVHSLDTTGSSFVAGNARRFNNSLGVRPSWAHLQPFARTRFATHITEMAVLARDRMVWNKVYRRSFWDEHGYAFPPIRYEDYPVTLAAHLDAVTVDVLSDPVYYWRERESGDSITQQVYRADNLLDRVRSANMVLDLLAGAPEEVGRQTRLMLAETDFVAVVQAFATVPDEDVPVVLDLGHELVERLGPSALDARTPFDRLQHQALLARDVELLRELALFRGGGGLRGGHRARRTGRRRLEHSYPGHGRPELAARHFAVPASELALRTAVDHVGWDGDDLVVRGTAEIRHVPSGPGATVRLWAISKTRREALVVERHPAIDSHGDLSHAGFTVRLPHRLLARFADDGHPLRLDVQVGSGGVNRTGLLKGLRPGSPQVRPGRWLAPGLWARPTSTRAGELQVGWVRDPWVLAEAAPEGEGIRVTLLAPRALQVGTVVLAGSRYAAELRYPAECEASPGRTRLSAVLPLAQVQAETDDDDPYLGTTTRPVQARVGGRVQPLVWTGPERSVVVPLSEHQFVLTRSPAGYVALREMAVRLMVEELQVQERDGGQVLVAAGRNSTAHTGWELGWRRYLPGTEDYVVAPARQSCDEVSWSLVTPVAGLLDVPGGRDGVDPLAVLADWTLFAQAQDLSTSVVPDTFLVSRLPVELAGPGRRAVAVPRTDTLHVEVRDTGTIERP